MERSELDAWLRLTLTPGVGNHTVRRLLALCGLPEQVFQQPALWHGHVTAAQARALAVEPEGLAALAETTWQWLHGAADGFLRPEGLVLTPDLVEALDDANALASLLQQVRLRRRHIGLRRHVRRCHGS